MLSMTHATHARMSERRCRLLMAAAGMLVPRNLAALIKPVSEAVSLAARDAARLARLT